MVDRRFFMTSTVAFATAVAMARVGAVRAEASAAGATAAPTKPTVALVDRSLGGSAAFAAAARARGVGLDARARAALAVGTRDDRGLHERRDLVLHRFPRRRLRRVHRAA